MDKNWRTIFTGLDIYFAAILHYCAIKLAVLIKELALGLRKR